MNILSLLVVFSAAACAHACGGGDREEDSGTTVKPSVPSAEGPVTVTPAGPVLGSWMETRRGRRFQAYRGVRYAEPPVGELRFQPPWPIINYYSPVDGTQEGPGCPQPVIDPIPPFFVDEDCLRLNVYTPNNNVSEPLPVIVFIHPGGLYSSSGRSDLAGPHYLLERDVVLVTINYRLGSLGFLSTGDELAPGNNGFKDQVTALKWIQRNIRAFGGDPACVTLTGYSAGSWSVNLHIVSPMSKGLFHRAIAKSGSPVSQVVIGSHQRHLAERQAEALGCPTGSSKQIIDCLKTKPWRDLGNSVTMMFEFGEDPVLLWNVVVEPDFGQERFLTEQPLDVIREGRMYAVPFIASQTQDEFFWKAYTIQNNATLLDTMNSQWERIAPISFELPNKDSVVNANRLRDFYLGGNPVRNDTESSEALGKLYSDAVIGFAAHRIANLMCRHSPYPVYYYKMAYMGQHSFYEDPITKKPKGVAHQDELIYLFTVSALFPAIALDSPDSIMVDKITAIWYNFARYGDPNPRGDTPEVAELTWPQMTPTSRQYLRVDREFTVESNLFENRFKVWDELYPIQY